MSEGSVWIGTANREFGKLAVHELERLFGKIAKQSLSPGDVFRFGTNENKAEALAAIRRREPIFLRHIQPVDRTLPGVDRELALHALQSAVREADLPFRGKKVAVQARTSELGPVSVTSMDIKRAVDEVLTSDCGAIPVIQHMEYIISVYAAKETVYAGWSTPEDNLSSWSGGAIHFRKEDGDISRAKYKLMEAEQVFDLDFRRFRSALDIGAAPGGWSSLLLERGLQVTAVDPAAVHPSLPGRPGFVYLNRNAADVRFADNRFDLLVCDMSWDPLRMAILVKRLLSSVAPGGTLVTTVKLMHGKAFATLREVEGTLSPEANLLKAKQLFHNREELTCCWIKQ